MNVSGGAAFVDLTKALSYITGSVVPQGATVNLVGIDYDSPHNNADSATESMYIHYYPTNDMLVSAWRNAFAAHCNAREDLNLMENLGEFVVGWDTANILFPGVDFASTEESQANALGTSGYRFIEDGWYNWACLENTASRPYTTRATSQAPHTILGSNEPEALLSTYSGIGDIDGIIVGAYSTQSTGNARAGTTLGVVSKFAIGGPTAVGSTGTAKIGLISSFNTQNPIPPADKDVFGTSYDLIPKYGLQRLLDNPMSLKIQTGMATHFTIPLGGVDVMCGLIRLTDNWVIPNVSSAPDETGGSSAGDHGTMTFWVSGWSEF